MHVGFHDLQEHFHESSNHDRGTLWELAIVRRERADVPERRSSVGRLRHPSHKLSGAAYKNWAYDGSAGPGDTTPNYRLITAKRYRVNQDVGDFVCHYGKTTGFGCGWIVSKYTLGCVANASASYIKVDSDPNGPGIDLSEPGDSGGPWYEQNVALGTMSCQQGNDAIYMASDYIETGLSATILTSP